MNHVLRNHLADVGHGNVHILGTLVGHSGYAAAGAAGAFRSAMRTRPPMPVPSMPEPKPTKPSLAAKVAALPDAIIASMSRSMMRPLGPVAGATV